MQLPRFRKRTTQGDLEIGETEDDTYIIYNISITISIQFFLFVVVVVVVVVVVCIRLQGRYGEAKDNRPSLLNSG